MKIFRGFRVFGYALWEKMKTLKMPEFKRKLFNDKIHPLLTVTITRKLLKIANLVSKYHFSTTFSIATRLS